MDFKDLLKRVKEAKLAASADAGTDPRTYTVKVGKIRRAQEDLKELFVDYKNEVRRRAMFIIPRGAGAEKFAELAEKEFGCFKTDAEEVYAETIKNVNPVLYTNSPFNPDLLDTVTNYFQDVADEIGLMSYPMITYKNSYARTLQNKEELQAIVKEAINDHIGSEVIGHFAIHRAAIDALGDKFTGRLVPIVLSSADEALTESLDSTLRSITANVFVVDAAEDITDEQVKSALLKIKQSIKNVV